MVADRHCGSRYRLRPWVRDIGRTTRHCIMGDQNKIWSLGLLVGMFLMCPALCESELVEQEFGAIWRDNNFNLDPDGANVCIRTSLRSVTSLLSLDEVTSMCDSIYSTATCYALRSGIIGTDELYIPSINYTCCDGFQREANACPIDCPKGTYGQDCSLSCTCQNGGSCDSENGECLCGPGWRGAHCERTCPPSRYGDGCGEVCDCQNGGSCDRETGSCLCPIGFTGERCGMDCSTQAGNTDPSCSEDFHCEACEYDNGKGCDLSLGSCICATGWQGRFCTHACQGRTYGRFCRESCDCGVNADYCHPVDGQCECKPGWTGERCDQECPPGSFGEQCARSCSCPDGAACDHEDGGCNCPAGWTGGQVDRCALPCSDDEWGAGCTEECSCSEGEDCEPIGGSCFNPDEYSGSSPSSPSNSNTTIIAVSACVVVAVIAIVVAIVVILRCRRKPTLRQNQGPSLHNGVINGSATSHDNERYTGPTPPPRDPSTLLPPSRNPSAIGYRSYESLPSGTQSPNSYMEIYEETGHIDNPLYLQGDSGYEVPASQDTLERGVDSGQPRSRVANPLYGGSAGYEVPTPQGTLEREVDGVQDDGEYTYLAAPRADNEYSEPTM